MLKLIGLEWKKHNIMKYILGAFAIIAVLAVFLFAQCYLGIANDPETGVPDSAPGMDTMMVQVEMFTNLCFLVFTAVMMSVFVIAPAKNGIRNLMFGYPIRRKQIIISEMAAVWIFCVAALAIGKTVIYFLLYLPAGSMEQSFRLGFDMMSRTFYVQVCLKSVLTVTLGFIALFIGNLMKSSKAAIIASFLLFLVMNGMVGDFSLRDNATVPIILFIGSLICAAAVVHGIEKKDAV